MHELDATATPNIPSELSNVPPSSVNEYCPLETGSENPISWSPRFVLCLNTASTSASIWTFPVQLNVAVEDIKYVPRGTTSLSPPMHAVKAAMIAAVSSCCTVAPETVVAALSASTNTVLETLITELTRNPLVAAEVGLAGHQDGLERTIPLSVKPGATDIPMNVPSRQTA